MSISIYQLKNGKWKAEVAIFGVRKTKTLTRKKEVELWAQHLERELIIQSADENYIYYKQIQITMSEALGHYSREVSTFKKTAKEEQKRIRYLQKSLPHTDWPIINYHSGLLTQWKNEVMNRPIRPLKAGSVLRTFSLLSAFFNWCITKKWIRQNPLKEVIKPASPPHRERRITQEELQKMLDSLDYKIGDIPQTKSQEVALIWLIAIATGMRSGEIVNRTIQEIDLQRKIINLPHTKNGMPRLVPLDNFAHKLWKIALEIKRTSDKVWNISNESRDALFRKARKKAGLENADLTFHDSRHEAASLMAKRLKNPYTLCKVFGWRDPKHALIYYNPTPEEIINELNATQGLNSLIQ